MGKLNIYIYFTCQCLCRVSFKSQWEYPARLFQIPTGRFKAENAAIWRPVSNPNGNPRRIALPQYRNAKQLVSNPKGKI